MRARTAGAIAAGSALAFAGLGFTAVFREGFETVLFYQALILFAQGLLEWVALGALAAAVALACVGWAVLKLGKRLPVKQLLLAGASMLLLLSVAFAGNAVRSLQEGDWISVTPIDGGWARLPVFLAELTGIHPTREGIFVQLVLLGVYVARRGLHVRVAAARGGAARRRRRARDRRAAHRRSTSAGRSRRPSRSRRTTLELRASARAADDARRRRRRRRRHRAGARRPARAARRRARRASSSSPSRRPRR